VAIQGRCPLHDGDRQTTCRLLKRKRDSLDDFSELGFPFSNQFHLMVDGSAVFSKHEAIISSDNNKSRGQ
jgi:hypothetical protein